MHKTLEQLVEDFNTTITSLDISIFTCMLRDNFINIQEYEDVLRDNYVENVSGDEKLPNVGNVLRAVLPNKTINEFIKFIIRNWHDLVYEYDFYGYGKEVGDFLSGLNDESIAAIIKHGCERLSLDVASDSLLNILSEYTNINMNQFFFMKLYNADMEFKELTHHRISGKQLLDFLYCHDKHQFAHDFLIEGHQRWKTERKCFSIKLRTAEKLRVQTNQFKIQLDKVISIIENKNHNKPFVVVGEFARYFVTPSSVMDEIKINSPLLFLGLSGNTVEFSDDKMCWGEYRQLVSSSGKVYNIHTFQEVNYSISILAPFIKGFDRENLRLEMRDFFKQPMHEYNI